MLIWTYITTSAIDLRLIPSYLQKSTSTNCFNLKYILQITFLLVVLYYIWLQCYLWFHHVTLTLYADIEIIYDFTMSLLPHMQTQKLCMISPCRSYLICRHRNYFQLKWNIYWWLLSYLYYITFNCSIMQDFTMQPLPRTRLQSRLHSEPPSWTGGLFQSQCQGHAPRDLDLSSWQWFSSKQNNISDSKRNMQTYNWNIMIQ